MLAEIGIVEVSVCGKEIVCFKVIPVAVERVHIKHVHIGLRNMLLGAYPERLVMVHCHNLAVCRPLVTASHADERVDRTSEIDGFVGR